LTISQKISGFINSLNVPDICHAVSVREFSGHRTVKGALYEKQNRSSQGHASSEED
jgi:hypothetical protein